MTPHAIRTPRVVLAGILALGAVSAQAMLDPGAVYCTALGYQHFIAATTKGTIGVCRLPNGRDVNAWDFYTGRVGLEWSWCAVHGYAARRDESGVVCHGCTVCRLPEGTEVWVAELMGLSFRESICGDGRCGTTESHANCAGDCRSGGLDAFCDGVADRRCDRDCVELGGADADCPGLFVDVMPEACPNPLDVKARGETAIAILGTVDLPAARLDPATVRLSRKGGHGSVAPLRWSLEDVAMPQAGEACGCGRIARDRRADLVLHFDARRLVKALGLGTLAGRSVPLRVRARLEDGTGRAGTDCVRLAPARRRGCLADCRAARTTCGAAATAERRACVSGAREAMHGALGACAGDASCRRAARDAGRAAHRGCTAARALARDACRDAGRVCGGCCGTNPAGPCVPTTTTTRPPLRRTAHGAEG